MSAGVAALAALGEGFFAGVVGSSAGSGFLFLVALAGVSEVVVVSSALVTFFEVAGDLVFFVSTPSDT